MSTAPTPASTAEALAMLKSATRYLAAADPTAMAAAEQAECLQSLEEADAVRTAAPASRCEIHHHLTHRARGGKTSVNDCALFCWYHHHIVIHEMGWTVVLNRDGTTTAYSPDKAKILHSHGPPPVRAG